MKKNKTLMIVLGVFALVIVTTGASFAFFQYQRTGATKVNVTSGDIQFSYMEDNQNAVLANAFPVADTVGAVDITGEYEFTVNLTSSSASTIANYNVSLVSDNNDSKNYFTNDQIKFALVKNNVYVAGTSSTKGLKLSESSGFTNATTNGEGVVLPNQEIVAGQTDTYKLRIWISDDVSYTNTINDGVETGKYNGYSYSLKVKITSGVENSYMEPTSAIEGSAAEKIINLSSTNTDELRVDTHDAIGQQGFKITEYRYFGATPNNYVTFNNEPWRIIGVFDVDDGTGKIEKRLKIIKNETIGAFSWDSSSSSVNSGYGINEWNQADLMTLLNDTYYDAKSGTCYNGSNNQTIACDFTENGLTIEAKEMLGTAKWYLGSSTTPTTSLETFYRNERSTAKKICSDSKWCSDTIVREHTWTGFLALIYPSDYGYAASNTCNDINLDSYSSSCRNDDWLSFATWTLSAHPTNTDATSVFTINSTGNLSYMAARSITNIFPVAYLSSTVKIISGTGTSSDPFLLSK